MNCSTGGRDAYRDFLFFVTSWAVFYTYLLKGWTLTINNSPYGLYTQSDGRWLAWTTQYIAHWGHFLEVSTYNIFSGMGSVFPVYNPWIDLGGYSLSLPLDRASTYLVAYAIYSLEAAISIIALGRVLGFSLLHSTLAAQLHLLLLFPPFSYVLGVEIWYSSAPVFAHVMALANGTLASFLVLGRYRLWRNIAIALLILSLLTIVLMSAPFLVAPYFVTYATAAGALLLAQRPRWKELLWKGAAAASIALVFCLIGFRDYFQGTVRTAARYIFQDAAPMGKLLEAHTWAQIPEVCAQPTSILACPGNRAMPFIVAALLGGVVQSLRPLTGLRALAIWFLLYNAAVHVYHPISNYLYSGWPSLRSGFLLWSSYTFYTLFIVALLSSPGTLVIWLERRPRLRTAVHKFALLLPQLCWQRIRRIASSDSLPGFGRKLGLCGVPVGSILLYGALLTSYPPGHVNPAAILRQPSVGPIVSYLLKNASLAPGEPFRGYTATYFTDPTGEIRKEQRIKSQPSSWLFTVMTRLYFERHYGNDFQETDLWNFNIPTFDEYGQWVSRQVFAFAAELLAPPGTKLHPSVLRVYKLDVGLLQALGVRFLITDAAIDDGRARLRASEHAADAMPVYLFELSHPNLATYSPTRAITARTFAEGIRLVGSASAELANKVILAEDVGAPYVPAQRAAMRMARNGFVITAESSGKSLLLLPVQFSHCLQLNWPPQASASTTVRLLRANLVQTAIEFDRYVNAFVRFEFGLFRKAACRITDARDLDRMNLFYGPDRVEAWRDPNWGR